MEKNKMKKTIGKYLIKNCIFVGIPSLGYILMRANQTRLIQSIGYRVTHNLETVFFITMCLSIGVLCGSILATIIRKIRNKKLELQQEENLRVYKEQLAEDEKKAKAQLSVNGKLSDKAIYDKLQSQAEIWKALPGTTIPKHLTSITGQLNRMNSYQDKLDKLLVNNGSDFMTDTRNVLENVEQDMLKKVRKIINCSVVYDTGNEEDVKSMTELLDDVDKSNEVQLKNVKEFLFAVTDYLNKQGDSNVGTEKLELYKTAILNQIEQEVE